MQGAPEMGLAENTTVVGVTSDHGYCTPPIPGTANSQTPELKKRHPISQKFL